MYFLNGDRIYIKPQTTCATLNDQIEDCFAQLLKINSGKIIFKLNIFVDTESDSDYTELSNKIRRTVKTLWGVDIILTFIAQPPLTCKIVIEAFYFDPKEWNCEMFHENENGAALFRNGNTEILVGTVQSNLNSSCKLNAEKVFDDLSEILEAAHFPVNSIVRQWNYLEDIVGFDGEKQRYQDFNNVRSVFYNDAFHETGYPAATGIGMNRGGVIIEYVALKSNEAITKPIDNPGQIAAHVYSDNVLVGRKCLKTTPKFERARYLQSADKKLIFISGTASITGEETIGIGDPVEQTKVTIQNIQRLYSDEVLDGLSDNKLTPKYGHARVYVKKREDFSAIKRTFKLYFGDLPVVYIIADICRSDLLVEIEGKVILE